MDKIDELLFKYNNRKIKLSEESQKMYNFIEIPLIGILIMMLTEAVICLVEHLTYMYIVMIFTIIAEWLWMQFCKGKIGTKKWKQKIVKYSRNLFKENQKQLIDLIISEGMTCQQVYNLLIKKDGRLSRAGDKTIYFISICSLLVALISVLVSPLNNIIGVDYSMYLAYVLCFFLIFGPIIFCVFKILYLSNETPDSKFMKKNNYDYIIKMLEDMLY